MRSNLFLSTYHQLLWGDRVRFSWIPKGSDRVLFHFEFYFDSIEVFHENHIAVLHHDQPALLHDTFPVEAQRFFPEPKPPQPDWHDTIITRQSASPKLTLSAGSALWLLDHRTQSFGIFRYLGSAPLETRPADPDAPYLVTRNRTVAEAHLPQVIAINPRLHKAANPKEPLPTTSTKQHHFQATYNRNCLFYVLSPLHQKTFVGT